MGRRLAVCAEVYQPWEKGRCLRIRMSLTIGEREVSAHPDVSLPMGEPGVYAPQDCPTVKRVVVRQEHSQQ